MTAGAEVRAGNGRPRDYRLVFPGDWMRIDLDPDRRHATIDRVVERQFRGVDNAPLLKERLKEQLLERAIAAYHNGGIEMYLSLTTIGPMPVPASMVATLIPPPETGVPVAPAVLADVMREDGDEATVVELRAGEAVRRRWRTGPDPDTQLGNDVLPVTNLDVYVPVPGTAGYLLLSFSTPLDPLADEMVELFDIISATLEWVP